MSPFPGVDDVGGKGDGIATRPALYDAIKDMGDKSWFRPDERGRSVTTMAKDGLPDLSTVSNLH